MTSQAPAALSIRSLSMSYGTEKVLDGINIDLEAGKVLGLLGPSGCGKTTLLRLISGLLLPNEGQIEIAGRIVAGQAGHNALPPEKRDLGMVFQDYALWPHMSVAKNVAFPLEMKKVPADERKRRVIRALDRVGLGALAERRPSDLSGGQQQRVAIARAIVAEPPLVLFDEPLSNLDRELRETMIDELGDLVADLNLSAVYVTHDHAEALTLSDQVAVMRGGHIEQLARPDQLVSEPANETVADFLRLGCLLPAKQGSNGWYIDNTTIPLIGAEQKTSRATVLLPEKALRLGDAGPETINVEVVRSQTRSTGFALTLRAKGTDHLIRLVSSIRAAPGEQLDLSYSPEDLRWFPITT
ncbi:iron(III) transport system ATP-binding protein [Cohaesibacter sp. ES.047]|uniref:ABC transporter ATP-binding protein n=1 Tax=Cohaesibacter sp. ES.047 TaxID=1798205 RepID=UPI000BB9AB4B|nr:ABC transporter ATP-binding protein [Cohaesibacter sp. ES.047]SNY94126.1 iron(III) transport system ATP-binding protein [Cohaesibacter sp. ES.047]